jgi:hypothetical protein
VGKLARESTTDPARRSEHHGTPSAHDRKACKDR